MNLTFNNKPLYSRKLRKDFNQLKSNNIDFDL